MTLIVGSNNNQLETVTKNVNTVKTLNFKMVVEELKRSINTGSSSPIPSSIATRLIRLISALLLDLVPTLVDSVSTINLAYDWLQSDPILAATTFAIPFLPGLE